MPEMTDAMYCHQQICIPPTYPYLLRQYAKAAIRSQPNDLLRWSCAYFRSLALGLIPPAKLRLEYPIQTTQYGLTPGWLKTLLHQLAGHHFVTWPQLYDRWVGMCLKVEGLKEIILLAEFDDPSKIPWLRFVAVAAGHLTTNLTNTMILICELLTDEPEGGSATCPYAIFADLYKFLASVEACEIREVQNILFTESNLDLTKLDGAATDAISDHSEELERSLITGQSLIEEEDLNKIRYSDLERYLRTIEDTEVEEDTEMSHEAIKSEQVVEILPTAPEPNCYIILDPEDGKICDSLHSKNDTSTSGTSTPPILLTNIESRQELHGEQSDVFSYQIDQHSEETKAITVSSSDTSSETIKATQIITLRPVPGIGGIVKDEIVNNALKYLKEVANKQKGMVMPRNIKHFLCPPLEECFD